MSGVRRAVSTLRTFIAPLIATVVACVALLAASSAAPEANAVEDVHIDAADFYFCDPSFLNSVCETTITAGDTVVWDNIGGLHTITQCDDAFFACPPSGGFDSGLLNPGGSFSETFDAPAAISYFCAVHPTQMRGRIIVEAQDTPTPSPTPAPTVGPTAAPDSETPAPTVVATPGNLPVSGGSPDGGTPSLAVLALLAGAAIASSFVVITLSRWPRR